jgi:predicted transcriptional regulator
MIDFACKTFEVDEVIKCGLGLTRSDYAIMNFFLKNRKEFSSVEISKILDLDLSTVQRALKRLNEKNVILRYQKNLSNGGYVYFYKTNDKKVIRKIILDVIHNWVKKVEEEITSW